MSPAGSSSSIAAAASPTRATTPPIWRRRRSAWSRRAARTPRASARSAQEREWIAASPTARQAKSKARIRAYDELVKRERGARAEHRADHHSRRASGSADTSSTSSDLSKGYGDRLLIDNLSFKLPPGGIVGVIGPNGVGKTTLFRMITGQEKPDAGADPPRRDRASRLCRPEPRRLSTPTRRCGRRSPTAGHHQARQARDELARLCRRLQLQGRRPAEEGRHRSRAASATACIWPSC